MERQVRVHVQRWEPMPGGKAKVKIQETEMNLANIVHDGQYYRTVKKMTRGRYIMIKAPLPPGMMIRKVEKKLPEESLQSAHEPLEGQAEISSGNGASGTKGACDDNSQTRNTGS